MDLQKQNEIFSEDEFDTVLNLMTSRTWLRRREAAVFDLFELCDDNQERELLVDLLSRFNFVDSSTTTDLLSSLVNKIFAEWKLPPARTKIVALCDNTQGDSAQAILWYLKPVLAEFAHLREGNLINSMISAAKEEVVDGDTVVLVDEFIGSGRQAFNRIRWFRDQLEARSVRLNGLYLCSLARSSVQTFDIQSLVENVYSPLLVPRGISDYYAGTERVAAIKNMVRLESTLKRRKYGRPLPSLGEGEREALYALDGGNTSNNVFPIFWWKWIRNGGTRATVLYRLGL